VSKPPVILCVDDDPAGLQVRALLLTRAGYRILTAHNGEAALRLFHLNQVDLVIIDPPPCGVTATHLADEMKRTHPNVPVIVFTGAMHLPPAFEQADLFLTKCIRPSEFLVAVEAVVARLRPSAAEWE
jgi:DNA-binding response OmpR family regulator